MKRIVLAAAVVALAGCSLAPTGIANFKGEELRAAYRAETNESLPAPDMDLFCPWDDSCYIHAWQYTFDKNIKIYRDRQKAERAKAEEVERARAAQREKACLATPGCMKEREIAEKEREISVHRGRAIESYSYFTGRYAVNGDEYDYISRRMCDRIITERRRGASLDDVVGMVVSAPGGDYTDRLYMMQLAKSCWSLSGVGVTSSKDIFPSRPY